MHFFINPTLAPELQKLMHKCNYRKIEDMLNDAVILLGVAVQKTEQGELVGSFDETAQHFEKFVVPAFEFISTSARTKVTGAND